MNVGKIWLWAVATACGGAIGLLLDKGQPALAAIWLIPLAAAVASVMRYGKP